MKRLTPLLLILGACQLNAAKPTNFIQILTDDQGWGDLHAYGRGELKTPYIDRLAADGMKFTDCYSSSGVCSPSRAAILTGRTPYRNGVYHWLNTGRELHLPVAGGNFQLGHDRGIADLSTIKQHGDMGAIGEPRVVDICIEVEVEGDVTDRDLVAVVEQVLAGSKLHVVEECLVATSQVFHREDTILKVDGGMLAADSVVLHLDLAVRSPTDHRQGIVQFVSAACMWAIACLQVCHQSFLPPGIFVMSNPTMVQAILVTLWSQRQLATSPDARSVST